MEKILVTVYVVTIDESYDVLLPINLNMNDVLELIQNTICELSSNNYVKHENAILMNGDCMVINNNNSVRASGLKNGCRIILI